MQTAVGIVLAAGSGSRMNTDTKKQYLIIDNKVLFLYSIEAFDKSNVDEIILVVPKDDIEYCKNIMDSAGIIKSYKVIAGGANRYDSVYEALKSCEGAGYVLIHDSARPCITTEKINSLIIDVEKHKACLVAVRARNTIKVTSEDGYVVSTPDRSNLFEAQTPQCFDYNLIRNGYEKFYADRGASATDDAMIVENYTETKVKIIEGDYDNIKVTTPEDFPLVKNILKKS